MSKDKATLQIIVNNRKQRWKNYEKVCARWTSTGTWTKEKEEQWVQVICPILKGREVLYKSSLYELEEMEEK